MPYDIIYSHPHISNDTIEYWPLEDAIGDDDGYAELTEDQYRISDEGSLYINTITLKLTSHFHGK